MDCEELRPLSIAFMGYNSVLTEEFIRQFCEDNRESVLSYSKKRVVLNDGTRIVPISPSCVRERWLDGHQFDQLILADDERKMIFTTLAQEIAYITHSCMKRSLAPPEFQILFYNPFEEPTPTQKSVFINIGISADDAAKAFARMYEAARNVSTELEIMSIRKNPNLSRFWKWLLIGKLHRAEKKARKL